MFEQIFTGAAALSALIAGILWIKTTRAEVLAPPGTAGVGSLLGGYLISLNTRGERIDLHATYVSQSRWNSRAAIASAISGFLAVAAFLAHLARW